MKPSFAIAVIGGIFFSLWGISSAHAGLGDVSLGPNPLVFSNTALSTTSASQTVTVTAVAGPFETVSIFGASHSDPAHFGVDDTNCQGATLFNGQACDLLVTFSPDRVGKFYDQLVVFDTEQQIANFSLVVGISADQGSLIMGALSPAPVFSSNDLTFAELPIHETAAGQIVTINNNGGDPWTILGINFNGDDPHSFALINECVDPLLPGEQCQMEFFFTPAELGALKATITLTDDSPAGSQTIVLSGMAINSEFSAANCQINSDFGVSGFTFFFIGLALLGILRFKGRIYDDEV